MQKRATYALASLLLPAIAIMLAYYPVVYTDLLWDDKMFLYDSPGLRDPTLWLETLKKPFFVSANYFRPLPLATFILEYRLGGLNPAIFHFTNLMLHVINVVLVMVLARRVLLGNIDARRAGWIAAIAGLVYGLHPALIEAVAWVSVRFDLLLTTFLLLGLVADSSVQHRLWRPLLVSMCFLLAALSKEMAVAFPLVLAAWHLALNPRPVLPLRKYLASIRANGELGVYAAVFVAGLVYLAIRYAAFGYLYQNDAVIQTGSGLQHLLLVVKSLVFYGILIVWPFTLLSPAHPDTFPISLSDPLAWASVGVMVCVLLATVYLFKRSRSLGWMVVAVFLSFLPVIHLIPLTIGDNIVQERFLVFPLAVFVLLLVIVYRCFTHSFEMQVQGRQVVSGLLVFFWLVLSVANIRVTIPLWNNNLSLWSWAMVRYPDSTNLMTNMMNAYIEYGHLEEAKQLGERILAIRPENAWAQLNYGALMVQEKEFEKAKYHLEAALNYMRPTQHDLIAKALNNLALAQKELGNIEISNRLLEKALEINPREAQSHFNLAMNYLNQGRAKEAEEHLTLAFRYYPPDIAQIRQREAQAYKEKLARGETEQQH